jgi:hypothetical protein
MVMVVSNIFIALIITIIAFVVVNALTVNL